MRYHNTLSLDAGLFQSSRTSVSFLVETISTLTTILCLVPIETPGTVAAPRPLPLLAVPAPGRVGRVHVRPRPGGRQGRDWSLLLEDQLASNNVSAEH